ncbi:MAG: hypothetical protein ACI9N9_000048 [Enterobacterales bacterium]|jgi:hypothetical protein
MNTQDWFLRKFPLNGKRFAREFSIRELNDLKTFNRRIGVIKKDTWHCGRFPKGTLIIWWRSKVYYEDDWELSVWTGTFDTHGIVKCGKGVTASGYQSIYLSDRDIKELKY